MQTQFQVHWMKIIRDITQFFELPKLIEVFPSHQAKNYQLYYLTNQSPCSFRTKHDRKLCPGPLGYL